MDTFSETVRTIILPLIRDGCDATSSSQCFLVAQAVVEYLISPLPWQTPLMWEETAKHLPVSDLPIVPKFSAYLGTHGDHWSVLFTYENEGMIIQGIQGSEDCEGNLPKDLCDFGIKAWLNIGDARLSAALDKGGRCRQAMTRYGGFRTFSLDNYIADNVANQVLANNNYYGLAKNGNKAMFIPVPIRNEVVMNLVVIFETAHERRSAKRRRKSGEGAWKQALRKTKRSTPRQSKTRRRRRRRSRGKRRSKFAI